MGSTKVSWQQQVYGPERARTLRSRLFVLLRDELGLGRQPKVAHLLVDEAQENGAVVESTVMDAAVVQSGQLLTLAPELGQGASWASRRLSERKLKTVLLNRIDLQDIDKLASGESLTSVRMHRMARLAREAYEQGATLTSCQLAMMTGVSPSGVNSHLASYCKQTGESLPMRGVVEDCSPAVTHKTQIVERHLAGESTAEIARATDHTPRSVERYVGRFEQVRELLQHVRDPAEPAVLARILRCSERLVRAYMALLPQERPAEEPAAAREG